MAIENSYKDNMIEEEEREGSNRKKKQHAKRPLHINSTIHYPNVNKRVLEVNQLVDQENIYTAINVIND